MLEFNLEFDPLLLNQNYLRARNIGEALGLLEGGAEGTAEDQWRLDEVPFAGLRRRPTAVLITVALSILFVILSVVYSSLGFGGVGARCTVDSDCRGHLFCRHDVHVCARPCSADSDCEHGFECASGVGACVARGK